MLLRLATWLGLFLVLGGCRPSDTVEGVYESCLCKAKLSFLIKLDNQHSMLSVTLYRGSDGDFHGYALLDGSFSVIGFWVGDSGNDPYPLKNLSLDLDSGKVRGTLVVKDFPNMTIEGTFGERYQSVYVVVKANSLPGIPDIWMGEMAMHKVEAEADDSPVDSGTDTTLGSTWGMP